MKSFITSTLFQAGRILNSKLDNRKFIEYKESDGEIDYNQILTEQDLVIENYMVQEIQKYFPSSNIISEEKHENVFSLDRPTWIIDPIDGSMNFFRGLDFYSLSLSYWENNTPKFAGVYSPYNNEMFYASKGNGATLNENKIKVSQINNLEESIILLSGFESFKKQQKDRQFFNLVSSIKNMRILSSSVLDMCYVAAGRCEGRIYSYCKFWDLAAAKLILEEAGGKVTDWEDSSINFLSPFIIASNKYIHYSLLKLIND